MSNMVDVCNDKDIRNGPVDEYHNNIALISFKIYLRILTSSHGEVISMLIIDLVAIN